MDIEPYLDQEPDRSTGFTERIAALAGEVGAELGVPVRHDADMNYRTGQLVRIYLGPSGAPAAGERDAAFMLAVAVSAKGPLWTLMAWERRGQPPAWHPVPPGGVPAGSVVGTVERLMSAAGLQHLPEDQLDQPVPEHVTDLDGAPATVRDVLFCEVC